MGSLAVMEDLEIVCNGSSLLVGSSMRFGRRQQREWSRWRQLLAPFADSCLPEA
jgi:hypothetical protein